MRGTERIQQQCLQLRGMLDDHQRMAIVELQPTDEERNDVLSLVRAIKSGIEELPRDTANSLRRQYEPFAAQVAELGYAETAELDLRIAEPVREPAVETTTGSSVGVALQDVLPEPDSAPHIGKKTVRFDDLQESQYRDDPRSQEQLYSDNERLFEDQDRRLDEMSLSVQRQRELGITINGELDTHNELLDSLEMQTDNSQSRLDRATQNVVAFNRKARECGTCSIIMVLVLILIVVILI